MKTIACWCLLLLSALTAQADESASLKVRVIDDKDGPLAGVKLTVHLWTGKWERTEVTRTTDQLGQAELNGIKTEQYLTISAEAAGWASTAQDMELAVRERREITLRMHRPAMGTVRILDSQGKPVQGAQLSVLHFNAGDGGALFYRPSGNEPFPFEPTASDAQGIIQLPPMPKGSKVETERVSSRLSTKESGEPVSRGWRVNHGAAEPRR